MSSSLKKVCQLSLVIGLRTSKPICNSKELEEAERTLADRRQRVTHAIARMNGAAAFRRRSRRKFTSGRFPGMAEETKRELECLTLHAADLLPAEVL